MNFAGLSYLMPDNFNFSGGFGLAGVLAMLFPYIQKIILHSFDFDILAYVEQFFAPDTFLGKLFNGNSALGTGAGIVSVGAIIALLQQFWNRLCAFYANYFSVSMEIPSTDASYRGILEWVHERLMKNPKHVSLQTKTKESPSGKWESAHDFIPNFGTHNLTFQGKNFQIHRKKADKTLEAYSPNLFESEETYQESIVLSAAGSSTSIFRDILAEVKVFREEKNEGRTIIYTTSSQYVGWQANSGYGKRKRPLESVILDEGVADVILADIEDFIDDAQWYTEFGVPYRRGYLLHGPPGTGKTSFISAVAGHFDLNVCILNLSDEDLTDDGLNRLLLDAPGNSIVLLEDVDAAFGNRAASVGIHTDVNNSTSTAFAGMNRLTFSGFLNALDGVSSAEGRILFMTTNHLEKLDSALIRPGRVDMWQFIGYASESQVARMFLRFYKDAPADAVQRFVKAVFDVPNRPDISLAQMQGLFLRYKRNPAEVFSGLSMLYEKEALPGNHQTPVCQSVMMSRSLDRSRGRGIGRGMRRGMGRGMGPGMRRGMGRGMRRGCGYDTL